MVYLARGFTRAEAEAQVDADYYAASLVSDEELEASRQRARRRLGLN